MKSEKGTIVSEEAVKDLIKEFFDPGSDRMKSLARYTVDPWVLMYQTTPVTDPTVPQDHPLNPNIVPQNKREFEVSLKELMKDVEDVDVPQLFKQIKGIIEELLEEEDDEEMKKANESVKSQLRKIIKESANDSPEMIKVRKLARKMIKEAIGSPNLSAVDYFGEDEPEDDKPRGNKHRTVSDVGGVPWEKMKSISGHQGKGTSGIEQYVYGKPNRPGGPPEGGLVQDLMNVIAASAPEVNDYVQSDTKASRGKGNPTKGNITAQRSQVVRGTIDAYVDYLASSGVLDDEEIEFLKDNPEAVETRPLFHDMLVQAADNLAEEDKDGELESVIGQVRKYAKQLQSKFGE